MADHDRPLAARGERSALAIGHFLAQHDLVPDHVVASPARRAVDTAARVLKAAGERLPIASDDRLYEGSAREVVAELLPESERLLVVGHEPELADLLVRMTGAHVRLPTAALAVLEADETLLHRLSVDEWLGPCALLHLLLPPKLLD